MPEQGAGVEARQSALFQQVPVLGIAQPQANEVLGMAHGKGHAVMAYDKIITLHGRMDHCIDYVLNEEKTMKCSRFLMASSFLRTIKNASHGETHFL